MKKITLLLLTLLIISCGSNDDNNSPSTTNKFTIQNTDYETPNAYLQLDNGPSYGNYFSLVLINGLMLQDTVRGNLLSTNTTHGVTLSVRFGNSPVNSEQAITNNITNGAVLNLSDDARAITNLTSYSNIITHNGVQYGDTDASTANLYEINNTGNGTVTINSFTVDLTARTGTVDCTYTITDENNVVITGSYNGTFKVRNKF